MTLHYPGESTWEYVSEDKTLTVLQSIVIDAKAADEGDRKARDVFKRLHNHLDYDKGTLYLVKSWERKLV